MTIIMNLLSNYWKQLFIILLIGGIASLGYLYIYDKGYNAAIKVCEEREVERTKKIDEQIEQIEAYSKTLLMQTIINNESTSKDLQVILQNSKKKPLVNPDCSPSDNFSNTFKDTIRRGNQK